MMPKASIIKPQDFESFLDIFIIESKFTGVDEGLGHSIYQNGKEVGNYIPANHKFNMMGVGYAEFTIVQHINNETMKKVIDFGEGKTTGIST